MAENSSNCHLYPSILKHEAHSTHPFFKTHSKFHFSFSKRKINPTIPDMQLFYSSFRARYSSHFYSPVDLKSILDRTEFLFIFYLGFTAGQDYFTHSELIKSWWGRKREFPEKNDLTTRKQNFACLTCDPS